MDFDVFAKKLGEKLNAVLFKGDDVGSCGACFNNGARTMYNYALVVACEVMADAQKEVG